MFCLDMVLTRVDGLKIAAIITKSAATWAVTRDLSEIARAIAQVISISGGDFAYQSFYTSVPAWKDTVIVPAMGRIKLLVPVRDYAGITVFHCHILEHEDMGMMGVWDIR